MNKLFCCMIIILSCMSNLYAHGENTLTFRTEDEVNNIEIFKKGSKSVVFVTNTSLQQDYFSFNVREIPQGSGTGIIWDKNGTIVTNYHVVRNASKISITLYNHTIHQARVVGLAPEKDIALLKIDTDAELTPLPIGDSSILEVGRKVLAIGNPFGLDTTLTVGVISALGREIDTYSNRKIKHVIQTDAAINPGNSGGPLLNSLGQLIGINTAIYGPEGTNVGIGFAIPVNTVRKIVPQLMKHGKLNRPIIGIESMPDNWAERYGIKGVIIKSVLKYSSGAKKGLSGIQVTKNGRIILGDIITGINDMTVLNNDDLLSLLENFKAGDSISLFTKKNGKTRNYQIKLMSSGNN